MAEKKDRDHGFDDGSYVIKKSRKFDIFAFVVCLLVAFVIWVYAAGRENELPEQPNETESASLTVTAVDTL